MPDIDWVSALGLAFIGAGAVGLLWLAGVRVAAAGRWAWRRARGKAGR